MQHIITHLGIVLICFIPLISISDVFSNFVLILLLEVLAVVLIFLIIHLVPGLKHYFISKYLRPTDSLTVDSDGFTLLDEEGIQLWNTPLREIRELRYELYGIYGDRLKHYWDDLNGNTPVNRVVLELEGDERAIDLSFESHYQFERFKRLLAHIPAEGIPVKGKPDILRSSGERPGLA